MKESPKSLVEELSKLIHVIIFNVMLFCKERGSQKIYILIAVILKTEDNKYITSYGRHRKEIKKTILPDLIKY